MRSSGNLLALLLLPLAACTPNRAPAPVAEPGPSGTPPERAIAMIDGRSMTSGELWPALAEASGGVVLQEAVLDRQIDLELARRGLRVSSADSDAERALLVASLAPVSGGGNEAARLLEELRRREGLGPTRFAALLRRNAALRAIVRDEVTITDAALRNAHALATGPRRQARIITVASLSECEEVAARARAGASFAELAAERSTDSSAARGGLLEPISRSDPAYPESLREMLFSLAPGTVSTPVLLPQGYVVLLLEREHPGTGRSFESMRSELERAVRLTQERLLMDQRARKFVREARVTVLDEPLNAGWQMRSGEPDRVRSSN